MITFGLVLVKVVVEDFFAEDQEDILLAGMYLTEGDTPCSEPSVVILFEDLGLSENIGNALYEKMFQLFGQLNPLFLKPNNDELLLVYLQKVLDLEKPVINIPTFFISPQTKQKNPLFAKYLYTFRDCQQSSAPSFLALQAFASSAQLRLFWKSSRI